MSETLQNYVALVTGGGSGIGRAIALRLAAQGMNLALCGRNESKLLDTAQTTGRPDDMLILTGDLTDEAHLAACVRRVIERYGRLDVLVNNAGITMNQPLAETSAADFDRVMAINVRAPYILCRAALSYLKQSDHATIVNIGSVVSYEGYVGQSAYGASKHALLGMTKALAKEVWKDGVRVHIVSPGGVNTDMVRLARPDLTQKSDGMIEADEVAAVVEDLVVRRGNAVIDEIRIHRIGKEPFL